MTGAAAIGGGIGVVNRHLLQVLGDIHEKAGLRIVVLSFLEFNADRPQSLPAGIIFRGFNGNKFRFAAELFRQLLARPVFVFDHVTLVKPLLPFLPIRMARTVIFAHGSESWKRIRPINRWLFSHATLVLTNSHFTLKKMRERIPRFNGVACPLGLAPEFPLNNVPPVASANSLSFENVNSRQSELGPCVCLLVGRMHPRERKKGHYELLAVWPEIVREFPNAQLVFAGSGDDRENIARVARDTGVGDSVLIPGELPHETLTNLYASCYAFTMPSRQEGFGLVFLEAMNFAKPCLGCRDDGAEDVIVHEETGLLVSNPIRQNELASALKQLLANSERTREMGRRGFARLHETFTAAHFRQRLRDNLEKVI